MRIAPTFVNREAERESAWAFGVRLSGARGRECGVGSASCSVRGRGRAGRAGVGADASGELLFQECLTKAFQHVPGHPATGKNSSSLQLRDKRIRIRLQHLRGDSGDVYACLGTDSALKGPQYLFSVVALMLCNC